ncbi:hypothetical protein ANBU17_24880 [Anaerostipes butyraticus]|uniref:Uncharacterized protein n=1 Tax=Anaerostipes butyraticus TaxID=645466 RepID=A0A916QBL7_9FIRM|nr:hypothetical protein ANBU17_24880 [Anaerostipes butyraticus]
MSPPFSQCLEAGQRGTGIVSIIDDRAGVRAEDRRIIVYSVDPQIEQDIHLRAFVCLDQLVGFSNREKEETRILFAGIIVFQGSIIILPVGNLEFDQTVFLQQGIGNAAFLLEMLQDRYGLMLKPAAKPILQF